MIRTAIALTGLLCMSGCSLLSSDPSHFSCSGNFDVNGETKSHTDVGGESGEFRLEARLFDGKDVRLPKYRSWQGEGEISWSNGSDERTAEISKAVIYRSQDLKQFGFLIASEEANNRFAVKFAELAKDKPVEGNLGWGPITPTIPVRYTCHFS